MKEHDIDRILSEDEILPSSGFTASVMDAVRREAAAPPPIPFPWKRALPGLLVAGLALVLSLILFLLNPARFAITPAPIPGWVADVGVSAAVFMSKPEWRPVGLALVATFFSLVIPMRMVLRRG